jgi:hypothetical protein
LAIDWQGIFALINPYEYTVFLWELFGIQPDGSGDKPSVTVDPSWGPLLALMGLSEGESVDPDNKDWWEQLLTSLTTLKEGLLAGAAIAKWVGVALLGLLAIIVMLE